MLVQACPAAFSGTIGHPEFNALEPTARLIVEPAPPQGVPGTPAATGDSRQLAHDIPSEFTFRNPLSSHARSPKLHSHLTWHEVVRQAKSGRSGSFCRTLTDADKPMSHMDLSDMTRPNSLRADSTPKAIAFSALQVPAENSGSCSPRACLPSAGTLNAENAFPSGGTSTPNRELAGRM
jgi:hypothetical protein